MSNSTNIDTTHDPAVRSWIETANGHSAFPIQNLPFGVFRDKGIRKCGVAIGDYVLDLAALTKLNVEGITGGPFEPQPDANMSGYFRLPARQRRAIRHAIFRSLRDDSAEGEKAQAVQEDLLLPAREVEMVLPMAIGDYTDFYAGIHHARNGGERMGRQPPLPVNYHAMPIAYHGRASTVCCAPMTVQRPRGQFMVKGTSMSTAGPTRKLDFELELGAWIGGENPMGVSVPVDHAEDMLAGLCLLNDLSARDFQSWEIVPLGPFLSKNFATVLSPWIVTTEALAPFRCAPMSRDSTEPPLLSYLNDPNDAEFGGFSVSLRVEFSTAEMRSQQMRPAILSETHASHLYWTFAQMIAHHTIGGCRLRTGDLIGSGTISAAGREGYGSLAELASDGAAPIHLPSGETRTYLADGDQVTFRATASCEPYVPIGFGECLVEIASNGARR